MQNLWLLNVSVPSYTTSHNTQQQPGIQGIIAVHTESLRMDQQVATKLT